MKTLVENSIEIKGLRGDYHAFNPIPEGMEEQVSRENNYSDISSQKNRTLTIVYKVDNSGTIENKKLQYKVPANATNETSVKNEIIALAESNL